MTIGYAVLIGLLCVIMAGLVCVIVVLLIRGPMD